MIPKTNFCGIEISRLILGDNPFCGHSYIQDVHSGDEMLDYYTAENVLKALFTAEENGINAYMALADPFIIRVIRQYKNEGGKMKIIFQSYPPIDLRVNVMQMMSCDPVGIYHQGGSFDLLCEEEKYEEIHNRISIIKDAGVKTGIGTHVPDVILRAERENWDLDFYMTSLYNARRTQRGQQSGFITGKPKQLVFYSEDPPFMYEAIQKVNKPCIAFKIFAGGQIFAGKSPEEIPATVESVFRDVYKNIKPGDLACIGVFQKNKDQLSENADTVKKVLIDV